MDLPLLGLGGTSWAGWVTTVLVWLVLVAAVIALLSWTDKNNKK